MHPSKGKLSPRSLRGMPVMQMSAGVPFSDPRETLVIEVLNRTHYPSHAYLLVGQSDETVTTRLVGIPTRTDDLDPDQDPSLPTSIWGVHNFFGKATKKQRDKYAAEAIRETLRKAKHAGISEVQVIDVTFYGDSLCSSCDGDVLELKADKWTRQG